MFVVCLALNLEIEIALFFMYFISAGPNFAQIFISEWNLF